VNIIFYSRIKLSLKYTVITIIFKFNSLKQIRLCWKLIFSGMMMLLAVGLKGYGFVHLAEHFIAKTINITELKASHVLVHCV